MKPFSDKKELTAEHELAAAIVKAGELIAGKTKHPIYTDEEKKRAAYALNLCMVSVSQIIDYNDHIILDQEYESILNNLNLENMPKDEALLAVIKQLLNTITFFRKQELTKSFTVKSYQRKIKAAIWSATPNPCIILTSGNPTALIANLATQLGIGYMNYRRKKDDIASEQEREALTIELAAIDQLNALKRELFETAWRLADEYQFPDEYRITERQITKYNEILTDTNRQRQYERLDAIKDKFEAYPPFWYQIANAAANLAIEDDTENYREIANAYYQKYLELTQTPLLRVDEIRAACEIEMAELIFSEIDPTSVSKNTVKKIEVHLDRAVASSGFEGSILQICSAYYLQLKLFDKAEKYLKILINEDNNTELNAQLLAGLYVSRYQLEKDKELQAKAKKEYIRLYHRGICELSKWPSEKKAEKWGETLIALKKKNLTVYFANIVSNYIAGLLKKYDRILASGENMYWQMADYINDFLETVNLLPYYDESCMKACEDGIQKHAAAFQSLGSTSAPLVGEFEAIFKGVFEQLAANAKAIKQITTMSELSDMETRLTNFSQKYIDIAAKEMRLADTAAKESRFEQLISGSDFSMRAKIEKIIDMKKQLITDEKKAEVYIFGDESLDRYLKSHKMELTSVLAVINDKTFGDKDLILFKDHISIHEQQSKSWKALRIGLGIGGLFPLDFMHHLLNSPATVAYEDVAFENNCLLIGNKKYANKSVNITALHTLIRYLTPEDTKSLAYVIKQRIVKAIR